MRRFVAAGVGLFVLAGPALAEAALKAPKRLQARRLHSVKRARARALPAAILAPDPSERDVLVGEACRRGLGFTQGSVVAMDPKTGRIISLINPVYGLSKAYQPCSVIKIVTAIAGLTERVVAPETTLPCVQSCWTWPGHGSINLRRALAVSCNPYFQQVGERVGFGKMQHYAGLLGLGTPSGINLDGETSGRFPTFVKYEDMALLSSHARGIKTTAVQIAALLSATLNGGILYQPQVAGPNGFAPRERWRLPPETNLNGLAEGFLGAVNEGTASPAFDPDVVVAGKTGTCASVGWFASYAPADKPEIVIVVFMRHGSGHGASAIAGRIYQELYKGPVPLPAAP